MLFLEIECVIIIMFPYNLINTKGDSTKMKAKKIISMILVTVMMLSCVAVSSYAEEAPEYLPETEINTAYLEDGMFYFASAGAEIPENYGCGKLLKIARIGNGAGEQTVRLTMTDRTASYGKDYKVELYDKSLFEGGVKNSISSQSMLEFIENNDTEEYNYSDAIVDGSISEEALLSDEESESLEFTDEEKAVIEDVTNDFADKIVDSSENVEEQPEPEKEADEVKEKSSLAFARESATGLKNDKAPLTHTSGISSGSAGYMQSSIAEVSEALNSAYIDITFDEGETEKFVEIIPIDNDKSDNTRESGFDLSGVGDAIVSGMYGNFNLKLIDDEEYIPDTVEFSDTEYYPENGYITVRIERSGSLTEVLTAMLDTEDDTALLNRDYSQVHAKVIFGFGIKERIVKIPVRSEYISKKSRFKIKLSEAQGCIIGKNSEAYGIINPDDQSFALQSDDGADENTDGAIAPDSIVTDNAIKLSKAAFSYGAYGGGHSYSTGDPGWELKSSKTLSDVTSWLTFRIDENEDCTHYDYSGYQIDWQRIAGSPTYGLTQFQASNEAYSFYDLYNKSSERWSRCTDNYFFSKAVTRYGYILLEKHTGFAAKDPTLKIYSIKPIKRPFKVDLYGAEPIMLINNNGEKVLNTQTGAYSTAHETILENAVDNTLVTVTGSDITLSLRNNVNPICYIAGVYIVNTSTGSRKLIKSGMPVGTNTVSFSLNNDFIKANLDYVNFENQSGRGLIGHFAVKPIVTNIPAPLTVKNDDRCSVKIWDDSVVVPTEADGDKVYQFNAGDTVKYEATLAEGVYEGYSWQGMDIKPENTGTEYRVLAKDGVVFDILKASSTVARPVIEKKENKVTVRVKKSERDLYFNTKNGIFANPFKENNDYYEYEIDTDSKHITGKEYDLTAEVKKKAYVPVWTVANDTSKRYSQSTFYYRGVNEADDNVILLTAEKADATPYSISGTLFYDDKALGGGASAEAWYPASGAYLIVDKAHYGVTNLNGSVKTIPVSGVSGAYIRYKIESSGISEYKNILLKQGDIKTEEFELPGGKKHTISYYDLNVSNQIISSTNKTRPYIESVVATDKNNTVLGIISINDDITHLTATVGATDPATGKPFEYTYSESDGRLVTREEKPLGVEFVIYDPKTHTEKAVITGAKSTDDGKTWTVSPTFSLGQYNRYRAGDILYARLITDRYIGNGKSINENGEEIEVEALKQTKYAPVRTMLYFSEKSPKPDELIDIKIDSAHNLSLPIIGQLTTMINAVGLSFGVAETETGGVRLFFGKHIQGLTKGNKFDEKGEVVSDAGMKIDLSNFTEGFSEMKDKIKIYGDENKLGAMALGVPVWSIEPMAGIYLEFAVYHDPTAVTEDRLEYAGGGGYIGAIGTYRYTYYMLVYGVPVYVGGDVALTLMGEFGIAPDENAHIGYMDPTQNFIEEVIDKSHFQFIFRAILDVNAYAGVGICQTLGFRGGFNLNLKFIANPYVSKSYPSVRPIGFAVSGTIKFWADAVLLSVPIPVYNWELLKLGYFEDVEDLKKDNPDWLSSELISDIPIMKKPRNEEGSIFYGHAENSTFEEVSYSVLIGNSYDEAKPMLLSLGDGKTLMVYLDDDRSKDDDNRTSLMYTVKEGEIWSEPKKIEDNGRAVFAPDICDAGDDVIISWVGRALELEGAGYEEYLSQNEIFTTRLNKKTLEIGKIERLTNDSYFDTNPIAMYDEKTGDVIVMYLKSEVGDIENGEDLINAVLPEQNNCEIAYMLYDAKSGEWVRGRYFENELAAGADEDMLINEFGSQRFLPVAIEEFGMTNPVITDIAAATGYLSDLTENDIIEFQKSLYPGLDPETAEKNPLSKDETAELMKKSEQYINDSKNNYGIIAFSVDEDKNLDTNADREIFYMLYDFENHLTKGPYRITNDNVCDSLPQVVYSNNSTFIFWLHDGKEVRYINTASMFDSSDGKYGIQIAKINPTTGEKDGLSISNYKAFVDDKENLFIAWNQNSSEVSEQNAPVSQDIYLAGYVEDEVNTQPSWSDAIKMSNNGKVNELPDFAATDNGGIMMVNSAYDIDMNSDFYGVNNSQVIETLYNTVGSIKAVGLKSNLTPEVSDTLTVEAMLKNTGVKAQSGYEYNASLMLGNEVVDMASGTVGKPLSAGAFDMLPLSFKLTENALNGMDNLKVVFEIKENGTERAVISSLNVFESTKNYELSGINARQNDDSFVVSGFVKNTGVIKGEETDTIRISRDIEGKDVLSEVKIGEINIGEEVPFEASFKADGEMTKYGYLDILISARDGSNNIVSPYESTRCAVLYPFNLAVNGGSEIKMTVGDSIILNGSYEPENFYRNAGIQYSVSDTDIASVSENKLTALREGETMLKMTVTPYGGKKDIKLTVVKKKISSGGGSGIGIEDYSITVNDSENGTVTADKKTAAAGETVTLTTTPNEGASLEVIAVCDPDGNEIELTSLGDGKYSFKMPKSDVTVNAIFIGGKSESGFFTDVKETDWFYDAVKYVFDNKLMNGTGDKTFEPFSEVTRGMFATVLFRDNGEVQANLAMPFTDVPEGEYYTEAVRWAAAAKVVNGTTETTFEPDKAINREEMAAMLYRYIQYKGGGFTGGWAFPLAFPDADQVSDWAYEAMCYITMPGVGLMQGNDDGTLAPKANTNRAELATLLMRYCEAEKSEL